SSITVSGAENNGVIRALSDMKNFEGPFVCTFDPGVIFGFSDGGHNLDLAICFHCCEMIFYKDGAVVRRPFAWAEVKNIFLKDAYLAFAAVARKAFPQDPEIQELRQ